MRAEYHGRILNRTPIGFSLERHEHAKPFLQSVCDSDSSVRESLQRAYKWLEETWTNSRHRGKTPRDFENGVSKKNWKLRRTHFPSDQEKRDRLSEIEIEFQIAQALERWSASEARHRGHVPAEICGNAVAATSGLLGAEHGKTRGFLQIDLVRIMEHGQAAELIELKRVADRSRNLGVPIGASLQAALYGLSLILWHANARAIRVPTESGLAVERAPLDCKLWHVKTLINEGALLGSSQKDLGTFSTWLTAELNAVAASHRSQLFAGSLQFEHSFHAYPEEWKTAGWWKADAKPKEDAINRILRQRWDKSTT